MDSWMRGRTWGLTDVLFSVNVDALVRDLTLFVPECVLCVAIVALLLVRMTACAAIWVV